MKRPNWSVPRRTAYERDGQHLKNHNAEFNASILVGGQIKGETPCLFNVYTAGNFIEPSMETPYLQIDETKYGKPIIDRVVKCVLISFDSTIRSNISVAPPIDLLVYRADTLHADCTQHINKNDGYYVS